MVATPIEQEMLELETKFWQAMKDHDVAAAKGATDFPCIVAGASGVGSVNAEQFAQMMTGANWTLLDFKIHDDVLVREIGDDVRLVAYKLHEDLTVDGKPVSMDAADASVWVRRNGTWLCALHTESLLGDAFGRDRTPAN